MIRFTSLSCSAAKAACLTDSGVWITTLFQVPFITGTQAPAACLLRPSGNRMSRQKCVCRRKQDVVCVNIQPDPVRETTGMPTVNIPEATNIVLQYSGVSIALLNDFEEQTLKRVLLTLRETVC